ncbi:MAG: peptidyl-prolyl cis-trans isomerase [Opitutus sp.]|nr:peptidyl-prolyl cis-trans isomerase [Opitutus sp.]
MISWIQRYFQHHFRLIFAGMLLIMAVPLIWVFNASSGIGGSDSHRMIDRAFFGYNLGLRDDQQRLVGDAQLSAQLQLGAMSGLDSERIQDYAFQRAATLHLADQWHIPAATPAEITAAIKTLRMFSGQDGQFDAKAYATFRDNLKTNSRGLNEAEIARIISADVRVEKVNKLLAGPGYVLPGDVKSQLSRADTSWTLATATTDYASYAPVIKPTVLELAKFFEENSFRYEVPARVVASYVDFPLLNYFASVAVTATEVHAHYDANPARFPKPVEVKPALDAKTPPPAIPKADPAADFAAVRGQVEGALKLERAQRLAVKTASDAALALYEGKVAPGPALDAFLTARKLVLKPLAPFTREAGPVELGSSAEIAAEAFKLGKDQGRLISEALSAPSGGVILVWKETQPARKSLLTEVREKVATDYTEGEKRKRFVELGKTIKGLVEARLKAGDNFEKATAAAATTAGVKLESKTLPAFTLRNRPQDVDYSILGPLERLERGQLADMIIAADKGTFVYAAEKKVPDLTEANPQFVSTRAQLASYTARLSGTAYVTELVAQELKKSEPKQQ